MSYMVKKVLDARAFAKQVFDEAPPREGLFMRPIGGIKRQIIETMIARGYIEGVNSVHREAVREKTDER